MDSSWRKSGLNNELLAALIRRKRSGDSLSLRDAAHKCGVAFSTLSRLERGYEGKPDLDTLQRLASWLETPINALFATPERVDAHLRATTNLNATTANALRELILAAREQFGYANSRLREPIDNAGIEHDLIPREQWERTADEIRRSLGYRPDERIDPFNLPIPGVQHVLAHDVARIPPETKHYLFKEGASYWSAATIPLSKDDDLWLILVNSSHSTERQRASLMEEYCHVLLGHEMTQLSYQEGVAFRDYNREQEDEAYGIGAAILVPEAAVRKGLMNREPAAKIAKHFGVSRELVEFRIKRLRLWFLYRLQGVVQGSDSKHSGKRIERREGTI